jgi:hypothetical protein
MRLFSLLGARTLAKKQFSRRCFCAFAQNFLIFFWCLSRAILNAARKSGANWKRAV